VSQYFSFIYANYANVQGIPPPKKTKVSHQQIIKNIALNRIKACQ